MEQPSVYLYADYRDFLKDSVHHQKACNPNFSYQRCAKVMKTSRTYLQHVVQKRKHMGLDQVSAAAKVFGLTEDQRNFLSLMVLHQTVKDRSLKKYLSDVLANLKGQWRLMGGYQARTDARNADYPLTAWLPLALTSLLRWPDFRAEPAWMKARLVDPVSESEVAQAWAELQAKGVVVEEAGCWREVNPYHTPDPYRPDTFRFYRTGLEKAHAVLEDFSPYRPCQFFMGALECDEEGSVAITKLVGDFARQAIAISEGCSRPDRSIFVSNSAFCVAK